jgi:transcription termination factor NusB
MLLETIAKHLGVSYLYEASLPAPGIKLQKVTKKDQEMPQSEDFQLLALDWSARVYEAASELDESKLGALIEQIRDEHPAIASNLTNLLKNFRFDRIVSLIQPNLNAQMQHCPDLDQL